MQRHAIAYLRAPGALDHARIPDGVGVQGTVVDDGEERARLGEALARIAAGEADTLLVAELDAAAGSPAALGSLLEWLAEAGASLVALDHRLDTRTGAVDDLALLLRAVARLDRGGAPRGRPGLEARDPELAARITALRADGLSLQAIARELNEAGVPTPRGGREWRASSVQSALGYRRPHPGPPGAPPPPPPPSGRPPKGPKGPKHPGPKPGHHKPGERPGPGHHHRGDRP